MVFHACHLSEDARRVSRRHPWVHVRQNMTVDPRTPRDAGGLQDRKQPQLGFPRPAGNVRLVAGSDTGIQRIWVFCRNPGRLGILLGFLARRGLGQPRLKSHVTLQYLRIVSFGATIMAGRADAGSR